MFFAYPIEAATDNWLHDCVSDLLRRDMDDLDAEAARTAWPECVSADRREALRRYTRLEELRTGLLDQYQLLPPGDRAAVRQALDDQAALVELFEGNRAAHRLQDLPHDARDPLKHFFEKAFEMLRRLGIRDNNYKAFLALVEHRICGFCGCEYFSGASSKREPLDHYLAVSLYPFAGANARNLVPMGPKCNSSYKGAQDILRDEGGARRLCFDPYAAAPVQISLMGSQLFARDDGLPQWQVDLVGDAARIETWDAVFDIKRRIAEDHLDSMYKNAIRVLGAFRHKQPQIIAGLDLAGVFRHLGNLSRAKGWSDRAFLETALYALLESRSQAGNHEAARIEAEFANAALAVS